MSKVVRIPDCANPFEVIVNGVKYTYPAGEMVEVPDEVAFVIEQHNEAHEENNIPPEPPFPAVLYTEQNLDEDKKAQARKNIGATAEPDIASLLNPNNLITDPLFKNGLSDWTTNYPYEITEIEGKSINGLKFFHDGKSSGISFTYAFWKMESGKYVFHAKYIPDVAGRNIGVHNVIFLYYFTIGNIKL